MRKIAIITAALALVLATAIAVAADEDDGGEKIAARGTERFEPNELLFSNWRFDEESQSVKSGRSQTWVDRDKVQGVPHTITIVDPADVPTDLRGMFFCREFGVCRAAIDAHLGTVPPTPVLNVGLPGLDAPGDSLFLPPEGSIESVVSAPAGATLQYICVLHPWMQGELRVR